MQRVGCTPHRQATLRKEIDNAACGLHTTSSNNIEGKKWMMRHVGCTLHRQATLKEEIDDTACGLHTASSSNIEK